MLSSSSNQSKCKRKVNFLLNNHSFCSDSESDTEQLTKRIKSININKSLYLYKPVSDYIIFKNQYLELRYDYTSKSFGVYANKFIPAGTILCIEKGILGSNEFISTVLQSRKDIAKELHPRNEIDIFTSTSELHFNKDQLAEKVMYNVWEWSLEDSPICYKKSSLLCPFISKFNHSCFSNAYVRSLSSKKIKEIKNTQLNSIFVETDNSNKDEELMTENEDEDEYNAYIVIYSVDNIKESDEITVSYGFNLGHPSEDPDYKVFEDNSSLFNWNCECGKSEKERYLHFRFAYREAKKWFLEDLNEIVQNYF